MPLYYQLLHVLDFLLRQPVVISQCDWVLVNAELITVERSLNPINCGVDNIVFYFSQLHGAHKGSLLWEKAVLLYYAFSTWDMQSWKRAWCDVTRGTDASPLIVTLFLARCLNTSCCKDRARLNYSSHEVWDEVSVLSSALGAHAQAHRHPEEFVFNWMVHCSIKLLNLTGACV